MAKTELPQGFHFRESDHSYFMDGKRMTGVTTILGVINKPMLVGWAARMACDYVREHVEYAIPGKDGGFWAIKPATVEEAQKAHAKKKEAGGEKGTDMHSNVETWVKICIEQNGGKPMGIDEIIKPFCEWAHANNITFLASEKMFYSSSLFVAGTADLLFEKDGKRYVGDIKTFKKMWDRTPMFQCAAYAYLAEEMGEPKFDGYCILRLSEDGSFEEKWSYDVKGDTEAFLAATTLYRALANWK